MRGSLVVLNTLPWDVFEGKDVPSHTQYSLRRDVDYILRYADETSRLYSPTQMWAKVKASDKAEIHIDLGTEGSKTFLRFTLSPSECFIVVSIVNESIGENQKVSEILTYKEIQQAIDCFFLETSDL